MEKSKGDGEMGGLAGILCTLAESLLPVSRGGHKEVSEKCLTEPAAGSEADHPDDIPDGVFGRCEEGGGIVEPREGDQLARGHVGYFGDLPVQGRAAQIKMACQQVDVEGGIRQVLCDDLVQPFP